MRLSQFVSCATLALAACQSDAGKNVAPAARADAPPASPPKAKQAASDIPAGAIGKQQAPVTITAELSDTQAQVTVTFSQAGRGVDIRADGVDGLAVQRDSLLASGRDFAKGESVRFEVPIAPGSGRSLLAIHVHGTFEAGQRAAVRAFPFGKKSVEQELKATDGTTTIGGEKVHAMPAEEERK